MRQIGSCREGNAATTARGVLRVARGLKALLATVGIVSSLSGIVGAPAIGWLCDSMGARGALVTAGTVTTLAAVAGGMALVRLKGRALNWSFLLGRPAQQPA